MLERYLLPLLAPEEERGAGAQTIEPEAPALAEGLGESFTDIFGEDVGFELPGREDRAGAEGQSDGQGSSPQPGPDTGNKGDSKPSGELSPPPAPPGDRQPDPKEAEIQALREKIANLEGKVEATTKKPEEPTKADPDDEEFKQKYGGMKMPKQLMAAIMSEDEEERAIGMGAMLGAVLTRAEREARAYVRKSLDALREQVPTLAATHIETTTQTQRMATEFYEENPAFNKPALQEICRAGMMAAAQAWTQAGKKPEWTPEFRAEAAKLISEATGVPMGKAQAAPAEKPAPRRQFSTGGGTSSSRPSNDTNKFADVLDV